MDTTDALHAALAAAVDPAGLAQLRTALDALRDSDDVETALLTASARVNRLLGQSAGTALQGELRPAAGVLPLVDWTASDAARVLLLLGALARPDSRPEGLVHAYFKGGDEAERAAVVRALALLPEPASHRPVALEAGRINSLRLYGALALNNPYPAGFYSEHEFNQVVLKSLFTGLDIGRIVGLARRANDELSQMCRDYVEERENADRDVPRAIWLALAPRMDAAGERQLIRYLGDPDAAHRYYAAVAATRLASRSAALEQALQDRRAQESEADILAVLNG
ncbi:MAG: EboA domain-containing protein [Chromatiaceae bacterium]|jgi:hypothetical protein|nr:EboA domain-containing protein [Chromatiaceae bacterium]